jgi:hypothetical protein
MMIAYDGPAAEPAHNMSTRANPENPSCCAAAGVRSMTRPRVNAAIIDPHHHRPAIARIDDANHRPERQRAMRRG